MDEYFYDAVDLLKSLIAIPSVSRNETAAADYLFNAIKGFDLMPQRCGNNIWIADTEYDATRPSILLNAHIDTVKPSASWQHEPFVATEEDERIIGLGANDDGGSLVSLLAAFRIMQSRPRSYNLFFLASAEEEVSGKNGLESVLPLLPKFDFVIVGEPTGMDIAIAEKGLLVFDGVITGVAGHAARNEGVNAIYKAMDAIERLRNYQFPKESQMLGPIKVSVTQIESGTAHNVVPDLCKIVVDVRTTDAFTNKEVVGMLQEAVADVCTLTPRSVRLNPSGISMEHPFVARALTLGAKPFGSPTLSDQALIPYPSVKMGPGDSARSHAAEEYITHDEIRNAIHVYSTLLTGLKI